MFCKFGRSLATKEQNIFLCELFFFILIGSFCFVFAFWHLDVLLLFFIITGGRGQGDPDIKYFRRKTVSTALAGCQN